MQFIEAPGALEELAVACLSDEDSAAAGIRSLINIDVDRGQDLIDGLDNWRQQNPKRLRLLPDDAMVRLRANMETLLQPYPVLETLQKANALSRESWNELQSILYLCDLRAVFDERRDNVVGFTPLVTMQLGSSKQNGERDFFELVMTPDEVQWMATKTDEALRKLRTMEERVNTLPSTKKESR
jgi:hypothetical protein